MRHQVPRLPLKVAPLSRNQFLKLNPSFGSPSVKELFRSRSAGRRKMLTCHGGDTAREKKYGKKICSSVNINLHFARNEISCTVLPGGTFGCFLFVNPGKISMHLTHLQVYIS